LVTAPASAAPIPEARFDDHDREEDRVEWRRRLVERLQRGSRARVRGSIG
jgi:hypothetical protein